MVASWVREPIGRALPRRASSTPAMKVEATAPSPTQSTPSLPLAGAMVRGVVSAIASESFSEDIPAATRSGGVAGHPIHIHEPLDHGDGGEHRQQRHDDLEHDRSAER